jgi:hypothetical protein
MRALVVAVAVLGLAEVASAAKAKKEPGPAASSRVIAASFVSQAGFALSPQALGAGLEYQLGFSERIHFDIGADLVLHESRTLIQPEVTAQYALLRVSDFDLHAGLGIAVPLQLMTDTTAAAVALRGLFGARWDWSVTKAIRPHVQLAVVAGPFVSPDNVSPDMYAAGQLLIGASYQL